MRALSASWSSFYSRPRPNAAPLNSKSTADQVLDALEDAGSRVKSFSANIKMDNYNDTLSSTTDHFGKVWFQKKSGGDAMLHVLIDHEEVNDKEHPEHREYLVDDGWLTDRNIDAKKEMRRQLVPEGQAVNLFELGKGPFPLPIGQRKNDVVAQFDVSIDTTKPAKDDPSNTIPLKLVPKSGTPMAADYLSVRVWVDLKSNMPVRIETVNTYKTEWKTTDLLDLKVNQPIDARQLSIPPLEKGWDSVSNPLKPVMRAQN